MSVINKISKVRYYVSGLSVGLILFYAVILFYTGTSRISMGIHSVRIVDQYTAHFMNVGLMYVQTSLLILIALTIALTIIITYFLAKYKK